MNKVIGFELKKMVSRPGIYILAILLAILLTVTAFIYKPTEEKKVYNKLDGNTLISIDADFNNNYKSSYNKLVDDYYLLANKVNLISADEYKENINTLLNIYLEDCENFNNKATNVMYSDADKQNALDKIHNNTQTGSMDVLYSKILELIGKDEDKYYPISMLNYEYINFISSFYKILVFISNKNYTEIAKELFNNCNPQLKSNINKIKYPDYSNDIKNYLAEGMYYTTTIERLNNLSAEMKELVSKTNDDSQANENINYIKEYNDKFNEYRFVCELYCNMLQTDLNLGLLSCYGTSNKINVKFFDGVSYYEQEELKTRYNYYFKNNKTENQFANALSFDYASNEKANGYDYTYFALSIFSVILIAFAITMASHSIAGESNEGTMRFLSIRPVTRGKILVGKFFAIAIMTFIMLIFSSLASFIVGAFTFGLNSANILTVINATKVVIMHPALSLTIFVLSQYLILLVYTSIAMLLSSFLKSDLLALVLTLLVYVVNLLLPIFFDASSFLRFNPFTNINLYAFVGAGTRSAKTIIGKMFTSVVYSGTTIWLSSIYIAIFLIVLNMLAVYAFKKREL